jgi:hypothetical protein
VQVEMRVPRLLPAVQVEMPGPYQRFPVTPERFPSDADAQGTSTTRGTVRTNQG